MAHNTKHRCNSVTVITGKKVFFCFEIVAFRPMKIVMVANRPIFICEE